jgi:hypothetical protein
LRARSVDVLTAAEADMINRQDEDHLIAASAAARVLFTYNTSDYCALHQYWMNLERPHAGTRYGFVPIEGAPGDRSTENASTFDHPRGSSTMRRLMPGGTSAPLSSSIPRTIPAQTYGAKAGQPGPRISRSQESGRVLRIAAARIGRDEEPVVAGRAGATAD